MVYPGTHLYVVSDPGVSPADKKSSLELSGTRIFSHRISVKNYSMGDTIDKGHTDLFILKIFNI